MALLFLHNLPCKAQLKVGNYILAFIDSLGRWFEDKYYIHFSSCCMSMHPFMRLLRNPYHGFLPCSRNRIRAHSMTRWISISCKYRLPHSSNFLPFMNSCHTSKTTSVLKTQETLLLIHELQLLLYLTWILLQSSQCTLPLSQQHPRTVTFRVEEVYRNNFFIISIIISISESCRRRKDFDEVLSWMRV